MIARKTCSIPPTLEQARRRFERWRKVRPSLSPIPKPLWALAVKIAQEHGVSRTAQTLWLNYHALKERADLKAGENLVVLGAAGGVGLSAVELGKAMGARVIAAASTQEKVDLAKKHGFKNLEYRLGDLEDPPVTKETVDLVLLSQALHHAIKPERAVAAARRILKKNGRIVVLDLLSHRFDKARELYADRWLGFSEIKLHELLEEAGFREIEVNVVSREKQNPQFQTVFATGIK